MADKIYMTWSKFDLDIKDFIQFLKESDFLNESVILALKRGGFPTAAALSNKLDIPMSTVAFQTRDGKNSSPVFLEPDLIVKHSKFIIPDDIYDTGLTVETIISKLVEDYDIAIENMIGLFHYSSKNILKSTLKNYKSLDFNNGSWVVFPWEKKLY